MPVTARYRDGKWRVVETSSGRIAKNSKGTAVDGTGHDSKQKALAQASAINASLKKRGKI